MSENVWFRRVLYALFSLACGLVTLWPFLLHSGVPAYQHDWSWSLDPLRFHDGLLQMISTWNEEGLGHSNPFATANPVALFTVVLGIVFPPRIALLILLGMISVTAGTGITGVAKRITGSTPGALIAVFLYVASPVFFNKTSAGQLAYLEAYALFPWTIYWTVRALREGGYANYIALAIFSGLECVQPQFFAFGILQAALFALAFHNTRSLAVLATVTAAELLLNLPNVYAAMTLQRGYAFTIPPPLHQFEVLQSARWPEALRLLGYIIPYADSAYGRAPFGGIAAALLWAVPVLGFAGLIFTWRKPAVHGALALAIVGILISMGERGPLSGLFAWGFVHESATTLFREFYHAAVLTSFAFAIGTACAVAALPASAPLAAVIYVLALLPLAAAGHSIDLHFLAVPEGQSDAIDYIRSQPDGRVLALPYKVPLRAGKATPSGIDVFAYVDRRHMLAGEYGSTPEIDAAAGMIADHQYADAKAVLQRYGVRYLVWRDWVTSAFPDSLLDRFQRTYFKRAQAVFNSDVDHSALTTAVHCYEGTCVGTLPLARPLFGIGANPVPLPWTWSDLPFQQTGVAKDTPPGAVRFERRNISPEAGWVAANDWRWADAAWETLISPIAVAAAATTDAVEVRMSGDAATYVGGPIRACLTTCTRAPRSASIRKIKRRANVRVFALGPAAISVANPTALSQSNLKRPTVRFSNNVPWRLSAQVSGGGPTLVVFRTRVDRGWVLRGLPVLRRVNVDGGLNGWLIDAGPHGGTIAVVYSPQNGFFTATWIEAALYGALLCSGLLLMGVRRRTL